MKKIFKIIAIFAIVISFFRFDVVYALEENEISAGGTALSDFPSPYIPLGNLQSICMKSFPCRISPI